ncbi:MAG: DNA polymerase III subunit beta [Candidatus Saccharimonadales bacterium]
MQISITQENLNKALSATNRVVGNRNTLPVLSNILLKTNKNRLKIAATNLEIGISYTIGAKVDKDGDITLPAKLLTEYIASLPAGNIDIKVDKTTADISSVGFNSKINGIDADDFPTIPSVDKGSTIQIPAEVFKTSLSQVSGVASNDDSRPVLTGIYLYSIDGFLYAVATDSYRLAEKRVVECEEECSIIVPSQTISEVLRVLDNEEVENIELTFDDNQVVFSFGDIEIVSRLIDGQFPNYRQLIPEEVPTTTTVEVQKLREVTKVTSLFARENAGSITLSIDTSKNLLSMGSITSQVGENSSEISIKAKGESIELSLNGRYLSYALSLMKTSDVDIGFAGKVNPCIIRPVDDDSYLHVIMPLRS